MLVLDSLVLLVLDAIQSKLIVIRDALELTNPILEIQNPMVSPLTKHLRSTSLYNLDMKPIGYFQYWQDPGHRFQSLRNADY